tara:strand:+ start:16764 stop:17510 length:747 start_codon:yes stop_codon:yes gene_type:complete
METLAVFHILKNGGTTLVDRYKHNDNFVYQRIPSEIIYNYQSITQQSYHVNMCDRATPSVIFGHGVTFAWDKLLQNPVKYATILRDPIKRMMSAYNYFRLEMINVHNHASNIDFVTWLINCDRMLPTPTFAQYQQFSTQVSLREDYGRHIDGELEYELYSTAIENVQRLDHILFIEDNYIEKFDKVAKTYDVTPDDAVTHQHDTVVQLRERKEQYVKYSDLDVVAQDLLLQTVQRDQQFYDYCKEEFA